ncbi:MAG: Ig-like domain-containing protein, partial [Gemmatimonadaceae bacterium]
MKVVARFMGATMNRTLRSYLRVALLVTSALSCSEDSITGLGGISSDDLPPDATRLTSFTVSVTPATIAVGQTAQASSIMLDQRNRPITNWTVAWSSSNPQIVTISADGVLSGLAQGTATVTATRGSASASANITVVSTTSGTVPVASVSVALASALINPGQTTQATATTRDANDNVLTGRAVTWSSSNNAVAGVSASGVVTAVAAGSAQITATSEGVAGSATLTVSEPPPPPSGSSPEPGAGDVVLWQDSFNRSSLAELVAPYNRRGVMQLITDGHNGQAIRFPYTASSWDNLIEHTVPATTDIYFRYWYRLSPGADPTCGGRNESGFKWFMPWRAVNPRYTMGVSNLRGGPAGFENTGLEFSSHDNTSSAEPNPFMQNIRKDKTFKTTADGGWHEYTL